MCMMQVCCHLSRCKTSTNLDKILELLTRRGTKRRYFTKVNQNEEDNLQEGRVRIFWPEYR